MLSAADDGIGNISAALAERGMDNNLVTVITTDNGGPNDQGPNTTCPPSEPRRSPASANTSD